jgi:hypothetical protein
MVVLELGDCWEKSKASCISCNGARTPLFWPEMPELPCPL